MSQHIMTKGTTLYIILSLTLSFQLSFNANSSSVSMKKAGMFSSAHAMPPHNFTGSAIAEVTVQAQFTNGSAAEYSLNTLHQVNQVYKMTYKTKRIHVRIDVGSHVYFKLDLRLNSQLIAKSFVQKSFSSKGEAIMVQAKSNYWNKTRLFTGHVIDNTNSLVSLRFQRGFTGVIEISEHQFLLEPFISGTTIWHTLTKHTSKNWKEPARCGTDLHIKGGVKPNHVGSVNRTKRQSVRPSGHTSSTTFLELYLVIDNQLFRRNNSMTATVQRAIDIVNYASVRFRQLNIYLALVGVEVWNDDNKIPFKQTGTIRNGETIYDAFAISDEFKNYRLYTINKETRNDCSQLLSGAEFQDGIGGLAVVSSICSEAQSAALVRDYPGSYVKTANSMVHEIGHNLGFEHISDPDCHCHNGKISSCIMAPYTSE